MPKKKAKVSSGKRASSSNRAKKTAKAKRPTKKKSVAKKKSPIAAKPISKKATPKPGDGREISDQLQAILESSDGRDECHVFFESLSESQRRKLAPQCVKWMRHAKKNWTSSRDPVFDTAVIALLWTCTATDARKIQPWDLPDDAAVIHVLARRTPDWVEQFAEGLLANSQYWRRWRLVRELVRRKLCKKPDTGRYYAGMISGLVSNRDRENTVIEALRSDVALLKDEVWRLFEYEGDGENTLANFDRWASSSWSAALRELSKSGKLSRRRLLDSSLNSLELGFNFFRSTWFFTFFDQLQPTTLELQRRADEFLALLASSTPNVAKWAFEKVEGLVDSGKPSQLKKLVPAIEPLLSAKSKSTAIDAIQLLEKISQSSPKLSEQVALTATNALGHEKVDVQKRAFILIESLGKALDEELVDAVERWQPLVAPSLKKRVNKWLESNSQKGGPKKTSKPKIANSEKKTTPEDLNRTRLDGFDKQHIALLGIDRLFDSQSEIPAADFDGTDIPRLDSSKRIVPIEDLDQLIDTCAHVIESPSRVEEAERALDGLSRLCGQRPAGFEELTAPLLKRVVHLMKKHVTPFTVYGIGADLGGVIHSWITQTEVSRRIRLDDKKQTVAEFTGNEVLAGASWRWEPESPHVFCGSRSLEISNLAAKAKPRQLLSIPTHEGGWIDPAELVRRINTAKAEPLKLDIVLAILRLAPDGKQEALEKLKPKFSGEWVSAVKYALGAKRIRIGKSASLWIAAARSRAPFSDDLKVEKAFPKYGPDCGLAATYNVRFWTKNLGGWVQRLLAVEPTQKRPKKRQLDIPTQLLQMPETDDHRYQGYGFYHIGFDPEGARWLASMWPVAKESIFAIGAQNFGENLDWSAPAWHNRTFVELLLDPDTPLRKMGMFLLLNALAAKEPGEHGLAVDVAIQAVSDGRLGSDNLGQALLEQMPHNHFKFARWAKQFEKISQASDLHGYTVFRAFEKGLRGEPRELSKGLGDIFQMLIEIAASLDIGIEDECFREFLEQFGGSNKLAKLAKSLLAAQSETPCHGFVQQAIALRVERLQDWKTRTSG